MSWFVLLTPLLVLPLLALLRLVGCSVFVDLDRVQLQEPEEEDPDMEDEDNTDAEPVDPDAPPIDPPPEPVDPERPVHLAVERSALMCPLDDDQPVTPVPIQLRFTDTQGGAVYAVRVSLERRDTGGGRSGLLFVEAENTGRPQRNLVCYACIRQQTPYLIRVDLRRVTDGEETPVGEPARCESAGLIEEGAVVRFEWDENGEPTSTLCLETA